MQLTVTFDSEKEALEFLQWRASHAAQQAIVKELPIKDLDGVFTVRTANVLRANGIENIHELLTQSRIDLLKMPNLGRRSLCEVEEALAAFGLSLR